MMTRRRLLSFLGLAAAAPVVAKALPAPVTPLWDPHCLVMPQASLTLDEFSARYIERYVKAMEKRWIEQLDAQLVGLHPGPHSSLPRFRETYRNLDPARLPA